MDINKYGIKLKFSEELGEISSIVYDGEEILYQGDGNWKKTFPICFPSLSDTLAFKHKKIDYHLPRHGFWKYLDWTKQIEKGRIIATASIDHPNYPFKLEIIQTIKVLPNKIISIKVAIKNVGKEKAYFHFGFHPAFKIEKDSFVHFGRDLEGFWVNNEGSLTDKEVILDENVKIDSLDFKNDYNDTIFVENFDSGTVMLSNKKYALWLKIKSKHLQIWKNKDDDFICIEPWYGTQDSLYKYKKEVSEKKDINEIASKKSFIAKFKIKITSNKL